MTLNLNLNHLAPDIQEELLFLPLGDAGRDLIHERMLRMVAARTSWTDQRTQWRVFKQQAAAAYRLLPLR